MRCPKPKCSGTMIKKTKKSRLCPRCWEVIVKVEKPKKAKKAEKPKAGR